MLKIQIFLVTERRMVRFLNWEIPLHVAPPYSLTYTILPLEFTLLYAQTSEIRAATNIICLSYVNNSHVKGFLSF